MTRAPEVGRRAGAAPPRDARGRARPRGRPAACREARASPAFLFPQGGATHARGELEDDFLLLSDIFPTGYHAAEMANEIVNPTGAIGIIGVFLEQDPGGKDEPAKRGDYRMPWGKLWGKGIQVGMGQTPVRHYSLLLRDLVIAGRARPSFIVSRRIPLAEAPDAYRKFDRREPGYTKVLIKPTERASVH